MSELFLNRQELICLTGKKQKEVQTDRVASMNPPVQHWVRSDGSVIVTRWQFEPETNAESL